MEEQNDNFPSANVIRIQRAFCVWILRLRELWANIHALNHSSCFEKNI